MAYPGKTGRTDSYGRQRKDVIKGATIYRSDNSGELWTQVSGLTPEQKTFMERHSATYGWVFGQIRVDPNDENTVYTMGLMLNQSTDGGKTFKSLRRHPMSTITACGSIRQIQIISLMFRMED